MQRIKFVILCLLVVQGCKTVQSKFEFDKVLWTTDWSPDGLYIAVGGNNGFLKVLKASDLSQSKSFKESNTITKVKWHPNEPLIAVTKQGNDDSGKERSNVHIINFNDSSQINLDVDGARGLGWSPNGDLVAIGGLHGTLSIYTKEGKLIKRINTNQKSIIGLDWHPTENKVVTVGSQIEIIDLETEYRTEITPREIEILMLSVEWHPSGAFFVTGDYGDNVLDHKPLLQFWNMDGSKIREVAGSQTEYRNLKWTNDGEQLATASDRVRLWSKDGVLLNQQSTGSLLWGIDWNDDNTQLAVSSEDGVITILTDKLKKIQQIKD